MKVLFLNPVTEFGHKMLRSERCQVKAVSLWPPLQMLYSAAVLRDNGFTDVSIIDAEAEELSYQETIERVVKKQPDLVVVQDTTPTLNSDKNLAVKIKARCPATMIAFIGLHSTVRPHDIVDCHVYFAVRNEPEYTLLELARSISQDTGYNKIRGLSFFKNDVVIDNLSRDSMENLDELPFPARDLLNNELYVNPSTNKPFTLVKTSRGCPFSCIYCTARPYYGSSWHTRSVGNIIEEIRTVISQFGITDFLFQSDTFNLKRSFVKELCQSIISSQLNISWMSNCRADLLDQEIAKDMKDAGATIVSLGLESGNQDLLDRMKKGITLYQARKAINICKEVGLKSMAYFMFGLPGETAETIENTIDFALDLDPDIAQFFIATPFPGTEFYRLAEEQGWLKSTDWSRFLHGTSDVIEYPDLSSEEIYRKQKEAYRRYYFRPKKVLSYIYKTRSLGQLKNNFRGFIKFYKSRIPN